MLLKKLLGLVNTLKEEKRWEVSSSSVREFFILKELESVKV